MARKPHQQLIPKILNTFRGQKVIGSLAEVTAQVGELGATHGKGQSSTEPAEVGLYLPITPVNFRWCFLQTWLPRLMPCCHRAEKQQGQLRAAGLVSHPEQVQASSL